MASSQVCASTKCFAVACLFLVTRRQRVLARDTGPKGLVGLGWACGLLVPVVSISNFSNCSMPRCAVMKTIFPCLFCITGRYAQGDGEEGNRIYVGKDPDMGE